MPEITYIPQADGTTVFFGADTRRIPELDEIARRFPAIDLALMPINGLSSRPQGNRQEVMDAAQAAELTGLSCVPGWRSRSITPTPPARSATGSS